MKDNDGLKRIIAARAAKELKDGDLVNLGIGLPTLIPEFLPEGVRVILHSENGIIGMKKVGCPEESEPKYVTDAGGQPSACITGGAYIDSCTSFGIIRGGHLDASFLGAIEVDAKGNLANWIIPGKKVPGMGGAMDLAVGAKKLVVVMEHTNKGSHKILENCSLPLTAVKCVDLIITEMGVFEVGAKGITLTEYNPDFTLDEIRAATGCSFEVSPDISKMGAA